MSLSRRAFLGRGLSQGVGLGLCARGLIESAEAVLPSAQPSPSKLPRWRGFNLLEKFTARTDANPPFRLEDFQWISEWGFDFVRLPMSYRCWTKADPATWHEIDEAQWVHIDQAVEWGQRYGVHVNLNLHRAPGYCVNPPAEPLDLFTDAPALEACSFQWAQLAKRYRGIPNARVSFDLLNEPKDLPEPAYRNVVRALVESIRGQDADRLIIADGLKWGTRPVLSLVDLRVAQSTRGYAPMRVSHHKASWVNGQDWPEPDWPLQAGPNDRWDKERLRRENIVPWKELESKGVGIHVGEWGAFHRTPHRVALSWMKDCLDLWREAGWGWALWNFRGSFGVLDSQRSDVKYEEFRGHKLDRAMLDLLRAG